MLASLSTPCVLCHNTTKIACEQACMMALGLVYMQASCCFVAGKLDGFQEVSKNGEDCSK